MYKPEDSAHWYDADGNPRYEATLETARKENLLPSVTTILGVVNQPSLVIYIKNQILLSAATLPKIAGESVDNWVNRVMVDADSHRDKSAIVGNAFHSYAESYMNNGSKAEVPAEIEHLHETIRQLKEFIDKNRGESEKTFADVLHGYAGKIDLDTGVKVIDYKSQFVKIKRLKRGDEPDYNFYQNWLFQLAAYGFAKTSSDGNPRDLQSVILSTNPNCQGVFIKDWSDEEKKQGVEAFWCTQTLWEIINNYNYRS